MCCCGGGQLFEGRDAVCGGRGKVVKVAIELGHVILRGRSLTSGGMVGQSHIDYVSSHLKVGGSK